jgi:acyl-CoA synthetase (AMP-forming)/AMP-acid ligase II
MIGFNKEVVEYLRFSNVAIPWCEGADLIKIIFLLDGVASTIIFLGEGIKREVIDTYYKEAEVNFEVYISSDKLHYREINLGIVQKNDVTSWLIPTSGTTSVPKLVSHTFKSLSNNAKININTGGKYRWGLVYDAFRFSGLQVILQSMLSGSTLILADQSSVPDTISELVKNKCNALSATPTYWRKLLMSKMSDELDLEIITLGGEISDDSILRALSEKFKRAKIKHIYASTEVGVGFSVDDGRAGFPKKFLEESAGGVAVKISSSNTLMLKNPGSSFGYLSGVNLFDADAFIDSGDIVQVCGDRVLFRGRSSGAINVGGNKVQPEEVEQVLLESGFIISSVVFPKKNSFMGSIVCAKIVLKENLNPNNIKGEILKYCRDHLDNYKIPAIIEIVDDIQTNANGKVKRG